MMMINFCEIILKFELITSMIFILGTENNSGKSKDINKQQIDEEQIPEGDQMNYDIGPMGHLIYKDNRYFRSFTRGSTCMSIYKCLEFKTRKCPAQLKTKGKCLQTFAGVHNHD